MCAHAQLSNCYGLYKLNPMSDGKRRCWIDQRCADSEDTGWALGEKLRNWKWQELCVKRYWKQNPPRLTHARWQTSSNLSDKTFCLPCCNLSILWGWLFSALWGIGWGGASLMMGFREQLGLWAIVPILPHIRFPHTVQFLCSLVTGS